MGDAHQGNEKNLSLFEILDFFKNQTLIPGGYLFELFEHTLGDNDPIHLLQPQFPNHLIESIEPAFALFYPIDPPIGYHLVQKYRNRR